MRNFISPVYPRASLSHSIFCKTNNIKALQRNLNLKRGIGKSRCGGIAFYYPQKISIFSYYSTAYLLYLPVTELMSSQLKKIVTITLAMLFGVAIVFFARSGNKVFWSGTDADQSVADNKWRDTLTVVPSRTPVALLGAEYAQSGATTTTDFIASQFIANYARTQVSKGAVPLEDADIQNIVQTLSEKARAVDALKQYGEQDLTVVSTSTSTIATYKKEITEDLAVFAKKNKTGELAIIAQAVDSKNASVLSLLADNIANYQSLVERILAVPVPRTVLAFHLSLLQGYANMLAGIVDMQEIIADPVRGMRGLAKYNNGAKLIDTAITMLRAQK